MNQNMTTRYEFKLVTEHAATPGDWPERHEWVDLGGRFFRLDAIGRNNAGTFRWNELVCNEPECPGRALYRRDIVERLADQWDEQRGEGFYKAGGYR